MTKNSKAMRRVLCGVVSFLLSFFSCLFVMCLVFKFTVLSSSFLVGVEKRSDYAEALHSELKEQFVSYGSAGNVDESFFDSVFENIITPDRIDEDTKVVITDFYNGEVKDSIDTSDIQSELETRLLEYAAEKGFAVDNELKSNIKDMAAQFGDLYNSYISLFSNSYFKSAGNMLKRYNPYADYAAIIAVTLSLIAGLVLRMSYKSAKRVQILYLCVFGYRAYASCGTACRDYRRSRRKNKHRYKIALQLCKRIYDGHSLGVCFCRCGRCGRYRCILCAQTHICKKEYLTKCQKITRERYDYRPRVFGFMPEFSDF